MTIVWHAYQAEFLGWTRTLTCNDIARFGDNCRGFLKSNLLGLAAHKQMSPIFQLIQVFHGGTLSQVGLLELSNSAWNDFPTYGSLVIPCSTVPRYMKSSTDRMLDLLHYWHHAGSEALHCSLDIVAGLLSTMHGRRNSTFPLKAQVKIMP